MKFQNDDESRFWRDVFVTNVRHGLDRGVCALDADKAVFLFRDRVPDPTEALLTRQAPPPPRTCPECGGGTLEFTTSEPCGPGNHLSTCTRRFKTA